jgi:hypothetical protein
MAKNTKNTEKVEDNAATTATPEVKIVRRTVTETPELTALRAEAERITAEVKAAQEANKVKLQAAKDASKAASDESKKQRENAKAKKLEVKRLAKEQREANRAAKPVKPGLEKSSEIIYNDSRAGFECQMYSTEELVAKAAKLLDCFGPEMIAQHLHVEYQLSGAVKLETGQDYPLRGSYNTATPVESNVWHLTFKNVNVVPGDGTHFEHAKVCVMDPSFSRKFWTGRV